MAQKERTEETNPGRKARTNTKRHQTSGSVYVEPTESFDEPKQPETSERGGQPMYHQEVESGHGV